MLIIMLCFYKMSQSNKHNKHHKQELSICQYRHITDSYICFHRLPCIITLQQTEAWTGPLGKLFLFMWCQLSQTIQPGVFFVTWSQILKSQILAFSLWAPNMERMFVFWYWSANITFGFQELTLCIQYKPYYIWGLSSDIPELSSVELLLNFNNLSFNLTACSTSSAVPPSMLPQLFLVSSSHLYAELLL